MPYKNPKDRNYEEERKRQLARGDDVKMAQRNKLRRDAIKAGLVKRNDGTDLDHKTPLSKGGANTLKNARVTTPKANRSFARNSDHTVKSQTSKKERRGK